MEAGTTVRWEIDTGVEQTESSLYLQESRSQVIYLPDLELESDLIQEGRPFEQRFTLLGDINFHSAYSTRMKGIVRVIKPKASAPSVALSLPQTQMAVQTQRKEEAVEEEEKFGGADLNEQLLRAIEKEGQSCEESKQAA